MKTYTTPTLVAQGDVVTRTLGPFVGNTDPNGITQLKPAGSLGLGL
jgi:hypothetical protein